MCTEMADWIERYSNLKSQFQGKRSQGLLFSDDETRFFRESLNGLKLDLQILSTSPKGPSKLPASEIARREVLITSMSAQLKKITEEQSINHNTTQDESFEHSDSSSGFITSWSGDKRAFGTAGRYEPLISDKGLGMRVMEMKNMQSNILSDIDHGVTRLHDQALAMGDEAQLHERLLDNMESNVDFAIDELREQQRRTEQLRETVAYTKLYVILVVEVIILVFLLILLI